MKYLNDGVVQIIVEDGEVRVIGINYGNEEFAYADTDRLGDPFLLQTLIAATQHLLLRSGYRTDRQELEWADPPAPAIPPLPFPETPAGL